MIVTAHQPNYLPWIGLFHKICLADQYVIYDEVELTHYGYSNRANIAGKDGAKTLSIPVHRESHDRPRIQDIRIDNSNQRWRRKHWDSIRYCYGKAPYFQTYADQFETVYERSWDHLVDLNIKLLEVVLDCLVIQKPIHRASSLQLSGRKSDRVIDLCRKLGSTAFIFGSGGRKYADLEAFRCAGIEPLFQQYRHPEYMRAAGGSVKLLSVIDLLFNVGPGSLDVIMRGQDTIEEVRRASFMSDVR